MRHPCRFVIALLLAASSSFLAARGDHQANLLKFYKTLHSHPELSFQEKRTASRIAKRLRSAGFDVTKNVGGYGVVGLLRNGDGPTLMLRMDMDALPVAEQTGLPYASKVRATEQTGQEVSVMHACGHDIHMAVITGAAEDLARNRGDWSGTLMVIAQPAEERGAGARAMLEDGLFERFAQPDFNLALHVTPSRPAGTVEFVSGWALANVDSVDLKVHGVGGHGAYPHATKDPVVIGAAIVTALQTLVSREIHPLSPGVVTVGSFHAGAKHNIISDQANLQLTVRSYSDEVRERLLSGIKRIAHSQAQSFGVPEDLLPEVVVKDEFTPSMWNDPGLAERSAGVLRTVLGSDNVFQGTQEMGGEDFSQYSRTAAEIPSFMFWLGTLSPEFIAAAKRGEKKLPSLHSPFYSPEAEPSIATGVKAITAISRDLLGKN